MPRHISIASLIALTFLGCATVRNGPLQRVRVESSPSNATVRLDRCGVLSTKSAVTPATVWVSRRSTQCRLFLSVPGEGEQFVRLSRHLSRGLDGYPETLGVWCGEDAKNCNSVSDLVGVGLYSVVLLVPGFAVDFATGSMFELSPATIVTDLGRPTQADRKQDGHR